MDEESKARRSVHPDLRKEREDFVRSVLHKGVEFTEELIKENQELQQEVTKLEADNARLRAQVASDDAIRDLLSMVENLEKERSSLLDKSSELETKSMVVEDRHREVERELNDLASLYVASYQLNASLDPRRVVQDVCELMEQLVGCERFAVYLLDATGKRALPVGSRGIDVSERRPIELVDGPLLDVVLTGMPKVREEPSEAGPGQSIAVLPLTVDGTVVGLVDVERLLPHKRQWASVDKEFFKLLAMHASTSLVAASLYHDVKVPRRALEPLLQLMTADVAQVKQNNSDGSV